MILLLVIVVNLLQCLTDKFSLTIGMYGQVKTIYREICVPSVVSGILWASWDTSLWMRRDSLIRISYMDTVITSRSSNVTAVTHSLCYLCT